MAYHGLFLFPRIPRGKWRTHCFCNSKRTMTYLLFSSIRRTKHRTAYFREFGAQNILPVPIFEYSAHKTSYLLLSSIRRTKHLTGSYFRVFDGQNVLPGQLHSEKPMYQCWLRRVRYSISFNLKVEIGLKKIYILLSF